MQRKLKEQIFPEIKDWTDPMNKYRYSSVKNLNYSQWFWFHPSAYRLLNYGINVIGIIFFTSLLVWLYSRDNYILMFLPGILLLGNIISFVKKLRKQETYSTNFYDYHMREYY